jgi:hypothetical protein
MNFTIASTDERTFRQSDGGSIRSRRTKWNYISQPQIIYTPAKATTNHDKHKLCPLASVVVQPLHESCTKAAGTLQERPKDGRPSRLHLLAFAKGSTKPPDLLVVSLFSEQISGAKVLFLDRMTQKVETRREARERK